ncbi:MAG: glycosyltransferase family 4 protein [Thermoplasmata archaeon]|nr:glycosyltransferase family 4 protein [Thermoplasmata archaeon]
MRICYVNPFFYPFHGGIEYRIYNVAKRLALDNEIYVVTSRLPKTKKEEEMDGIKIIRLPSFFVNIYNPPFVWSRGVYEKLKEIKPDVIDFHYRWAPSYTHAINKINAPKIFTFHNDFGEGVGIERIASYVNDAIFKIFLQKFDKIICISNYIKNRLAKYGIKKEKLITIYNGIDANGEWHEKENYMLFVGRLVRTKGIDLLIQALKIAGKNIEVRVAGKGPMMEKWKKMAARYEVNIKFLGWVDEYKKIELMKKSRAFILPSLYESFGIVLLEAMKYGCPIIARGVGGIPEVVGDAGILVDGVEEMAEAIKKLHRDDSIVKKLGMEGLKRAKNFNWEKITKKTMEVYEEVVK